jgi:hypothetical protein
MKKIIMSVLLLTVVLIVSGCSAQLSPKAGGEESNIFQLPVPDQKFVGTSCKYFEADSPGTNAIELCESVGRTCVAEIFMLRNILYESKDGSCSGKIQSLVVSKDIGSCSAGMSNMGCGGNVNEEMSAEPYYGDGSVNRTSYSRAKAICC